MRSVVAAGLILLLGCGNAPLPANAKKAPDDGFEAIRTSVCSGRYAEAIPKLIAYRGKHESRAGLFLGKAYWASGDLENARAAFEATIVNYAGTLEAHKCKYKLALMDYVAGDAAKAKAGFQAIADAKEGPLVPEATVMAQFIE